MTSILRPQSLGQSTEGRSIDAWRVTTGPVSLLLLGGVHGDEPEGFGFVERFLSEALWKELEGRASLWIVPRLNPDGCSRDERRNARGVDLNRNMPTKDWTPVIAKPRYHPGEQPGSEIETQILMRFIEAQGFSAIVSAHSWNPMINYNGPAKGLATWMSKFSGYRIDDDIGYPTPGSLGTWAGWERSIPTITLEIERGLALEKAWSVHAKSVLEGFLYASRHSKDLNTVVDHR